MSLTFISRSAAKRSRSASSAAGRRTVRLLDFCCFVAGTVSQVYDTLRRVSSPLAEKQGDERPRSNPQRPPCSRPRNVQAHRRRRRHGPDAVKTLGITSPLTRVPDVKTAQQRLNGGNVFKTDWLQGPVDSVFGELSGQACRRAKWWV